MLIYYESYQRLCSYRTRNRRSVENYANFIQPDVVVVSNYTIEVTSLTSGGARVSALRLTFYVILPDDAERAPYRETNYVVPRATLSEIVNQDGAVIEAVVRNSLSPPLTRSVEQVNGWQVAGVTFSIIFSIILVAIILIVLGKVIFLVKEK